MDIDIIDRAPETKAGIAEEAFVTQDDLMRVHEEYKATNDRVAALEKRGTTDPLMAEGITVTAYSIPNCPVRCRRSSRGRLFACAGWNWVNG